MNCYKCGGTSGSIECRKCEREAREKRTVFYVWCATADENQSGIHHKSKPFTTEKEAQAEANLKWDTNDFVSIDKVREVYADFGWRQVDGTETEIIEVI
jgi:hypothetical protein